LWTPTVSYLLGVSDFRFRQLLVERLSYGRLKSPKEDGDAPEWIAPFVGSLCSRIARGVLQKLNVDIQAMSSESDERVVEKPV
jgi:hypothetical protein